MIKDHSAWAERLLKPSLVTDNPVNPHAMWIKHWKSTAWKHSHNSNYGNSKVTMLEYGHNESIVIPISWKSLYV